MTNRAEFPRSVRTIIAERAGYQCSVLNCGRLTIGPSPNGGNVLRTGMAAHIYAATPGGPRGTGGLSAEERSAPENGIWCCYTHGKAIDSDPVGIHSAAQLRAWKRLHEARKSAEVTGITSDNYGLVESITIDSAPAALAGRKFPLGMRMSALMEFLHELVIRSRNSPSCRSSWTGWSLVVSNTVLAGGQSKAAARRRCLDLGSDAPARFVVGG